MEIFWILGDSDTKYKYTHVEDLKNLARHVDKYKLYLLIGSFLLPSTEFLLGFFSIREKNIFLPNLIVGVFGFAIFIASNYLTFIAQNLHKFMPVFCVIYSLGVCFEIRKDQTNIITLTELSERLVFSAYIFYRIKHFFAYILCLFFVLLGFYLWGDLSLKTFILYDVILLMSFGLNYSKHIIETNIINHLINTHNLIRKGNLWEAGIYKDEILEFISKKVNKVLNCAENLKIGNYWNVETSKITIGRTR
jgi:hypothetical protein